MRTAITRAISASLILSATLALAACGGGGPSETITLTLEPACTFSCPRDPSGTEIVATPPAPFEPPPTAQVPSRPASPAPVPVASNPPPAPSPGIPLSTPPAPVSGDVIAEAPRPTSPAPAPTPAPVVEPEPAPVVTLRQPRPEWPTGPDAPRTNRSLNWWGAHPQDLDDVNRRCSPQPDCVIPDGDLNEWNRYCELGQNETGYPVEFCKVPLYDEPARVPPTMPSGPPPGMVRPDPMTASEAQIVEWNRYCITPRCMIVQGVPS